MQPEAKLVKSIQSLLVRKGARSFKIHGEDSFQEVGIPDLLCCYRGRFVGLEAKLPGNKPSPVQKVVLNEIVAAGGYASVVSTVGQVASLLARIDREVEDEAEGRYVDPDRRWRLLRDSIGGKASRLSH